MTRRHHSSSVLAALSVLVLVGCGSDDGTDSSGATTSEPAPATSAPAAASAEPSGSADAGGADAASAFCDELEANGATGADFGPVPIFYAKEQLLEDVGTKLAAVGDATPPEEIAAAWQLQKDNLAAVKAAAEQLPAGGTLDAVSGPAVAGTPELEQAQQTLTDFWFDTCSTS